MERFPGRPEVTVQRMDWCVCVHTTNKLKEGFCVLMGLGETKEGKHLEGWLRVKQAQKEGQKQQEASFRRWQADEQLLKWSPVHLHEEICVCIKKYCTCDVFFLN